MSLHSDVEPILKVQNIDLEIISIKESLNEIPTQVKLLEEKKNQFKSILQNVDEDLKRQKLSQKELEKDIECKKTNLLKISSQLNSVKKNEEYTALLKEIDLHKKEIFQVENKIIEIMESLESMETEKDKRKKQILEEEAQISREIQEKNLQLATLKSKISEMEKNRTEAASLCSGQLFQKYQKFVDKKQAIALVPLEKNGACSGCHQILPPNIKNDVLKGRIVQCDNCARLLFWDKNADEKTADPEVS